MKKHRYTLKIRKITALLLAGALVFSCLFSALPAEAKEKSEYGSSYSAIVGKGTKKGIHDIFPNTYWAGLDALQKAHPNWKFQAFYTSLDWDECFDWSFSLYDSNGESEMYYGRNLLEGLSEYPLASGEKAYVHPSSWYSLESHRHYSSDYSGIETNAAFNWADNSWVVISAPNWVQASEEAVRYCMDPRNFFTEQQIFQFEDVVMSDLTGNPSLKEVEAVFKNVSGSDFWVKSAEDTGIVSTLKESKGKKMTYAQAMYAIGNEIGISPVFLASRIVQEQGTGMKQVKVPVKAPEETESTVNSESEESGKKTESSKAETESSNTEAESSKTETEEKTTESALASESDKSSESGKTTDEEKTSESETSEEEYEIRYEVRDLISGKAEFTITYGTEKGKKKTGYYNYFNMEATDGEENDYQKIIDAGLTEAYYAGWDTPFKALLGGAKKLTQNYINSGQSTFYFQKFNVNPGTDPLADQDDPEYNLKTNRKRCLWGQYMGSLTTPQHEAAKTYAGYVSGGDSSVLNAVRLFIIPVFNNMPAKPEPMPTKDGNPNYKIGSIYISYKEMTKDGKNKTTKAASVKDFDPDSFQYSWEVEYEDIETTLYINPYAKDTSKIQINGKTIWPVSDESVTSIKFTTPLQIGDNKLNVKCIAENGDQKTYQLLIHRLGDIVYGDINSDGKFNSLDLAYMTSHLLGKNILTGNALKAADISGDDKVNSLDLAYLTSYLLGKIKKLPR